MIQPTLDVLLEHWLPIRVPTTQRRTAFDDIARGPFDPEAVQVLKRRSTGRISIGAQKGMCRQGRSKRPNSIPPFLSTLDTGSIDQTYLAGLVVWADDVELPVLDLLEHEVNRFLGGPSSFGLLSKSIGGVGACELRISPPRAVRRRVRSQFA